MGISNNSSHSTENYYNPFHVWHWQPELPYLLAAGWLIITIGCKLLSVKVFRIPRCFIFRKRLSQSEESSAMAMGSGDVEARFISSNASISASNGHLYGSSGGGLNKLPINHNKHKLYDPSEKQHYFHFQLERFVPESTALILVGLVMGLSLTNIPMHESHHGSDISAKSPADNKHPLQLRPEYVLKILLYPIVMNAAWSVEKGLFYRYLGTILTFAFAGTILNAAILAAVFFATASNNWGWTNMEFSAVEASMFGVIICAVDPVAVLSVFDSMGIDRQLNIIVFGESLLNDGVAVVFYHAFEGMASTQKALESSGGTFDLAASMGLLCLSLAYCILMSSVLAVIGAFLIALLAKSLFRNQEMLVFGLLAGNYFFFVVAEIVKGSGILTLFFMVLFQRQYVQANMEHSALETTSYLLKQTSQLSESLIFLLMGVSLFSKRFDSQSFDIWFIVLVIVGCYVSRFIVVYFLGFILNQFRERKMSYRKHLFIQSHGGLRGAISFSLALILDEECFKQKAKMESATAMMVLFSVLILGTTVKGLVKLCSTRREVERELRCFDSLQEQVMQRCYEALEDIVGNGSLWMRWQIYYRELNNRHLKGMLMHGQAMEKMCRSSSMVRLHHRLSILGAQEMIEKDGENLTMLVSLQKRDSMISALSLAKNRSSRNFHELTAAANAEADVEIGQSVPDFAQLDAAQTRRDVDDYMTHHNQLDYSAKPRRIPRRSFGKSNPGPVQAVAASKQEEEERAHGGVHSCEAYYRPHRVICISQDDLEADPEAALDNIRRVFGQKKKPCLGLSSSHVKFSVVDLHAKDEMSQDEHAALLSAAAAAATGNYQTPTAPPPPAANGGKVIFTLHHPDDDEDEDDIPEEDEDLISTHAAQDEADVRMALVPPSVPTPQFLQPPRPSILSSLTSPLRKNSIQLSPFANLLAPAGDHRKDSIKTSEEDVGNKVNAPPPPTTQSGGRKNSLVPPPGLARLRVMTAPNFANLLAAAEEAAAANCYLAPAMSGSGAGDREPSALDQLPWRNSPDHAGNHAQRDEGHAVLACVPHHSGDTEDQQDNRLNNHVLT